MQYSYPDQFGNFGKYGGAYVPEILIPILEQVDREYQLAKSDVIFQQEFKDLLEKFSGRPTPLYKAQNLRNEIFGENSECEIYLKREDLNHLGAHKINNCIGQALLARRMNKNRIIAETGAGQHGVATASACAMMGLECVIYMGEKDMERQAPNVLRMKLLGAKVIPACSGTRTLKDAVNETIRDFVVNVQDTYYLLGSVVGPHPYPMMVRDFQSVIGQEILQQFPNISGRDLPNMIVACIGGGSNAIGAFYEFIPHFETKLIAVEAAGHGIESNKHAATMTKGKYGVFQGAASYLLYNEDGQISPPHSISAGLDYPGVGPEHALLKDLDRIEYQSATDEEAKDAFKLLCKTEGIIPALEPSHAIAYLIKNARKIKKHHSNASIVVNLSGRGDKDLSHFMV